MRTYRRGDVWLANLDPVIGSEQGKTRPVVIVQNDVANEYSPAVIVAAVTTVLGPKEYPTEVRVRAPEGGLKRDSAILLNQIRTIDRFARQAPDFRPGKDSARCGTMFMRPTPPTAGHAGSNAGEIRAADQALGPGTHRSDPARDCRRNPPASGGGGCQKRRMVERWGTLGLETMKRLDEVLKISLALVPI